MNIESARYVKPFNENGVTDLNASECGILSTINGQEVLVPLTSGNRYYREIMRQVAAGELIIADAD